MSKITEQLIKSLKPTGKRYWRPDSDIKGFCARISPRGRIDYCFRYRIGKAQSTISIGPSTALTASQARLQAKQLAAEVAAGRDPQDSKRAQRAIPLFREFAQQYLEMTVKLSIDQDAAKIRDVLNPHWGSKPINAIKTTDVRRLLSALSERRTPATVNRYRSLIVTIFNRAIEYGALETNPAAPVKPLEENNKRERFLSPSEILAFLQALDNQPGNAANAIRLMLFTGIRKGNVLRMKWDEVNLAEREWLIPKTKSGRSHRVPLNESAVGALESQLRFREAENPYVFPGNKKGTCLTTVHNVWVKVRDEIGLTNCRLHDLRHTFASHLTMATGDLPAVAKLLGHQSTAMTARYAHLANDHLLQRSLTFDSVIAALPNTQISRKAP